MTEHIVKAEGHPTLVKDLVSGVVRNTDQAGYQAYIDHRNKKLELEERVQGLEDKLTQILNLLQGKT